MRYHFLTTCVSCGDGQAIHDMTDSAVEITRRSFLNAVDRDEMREIEKDFGYSRDSLTMAQDWAISYHRSTYKGQPCVYFDHSRIEHIFT